MSLPYRTRRRINRIGTVLLTLLVILAVTWLCWVVWLERYVVYTDDGATVDFELSAHELEGEVAVPPVAAENISIYYNEGADSISVGNELTQLKGYYIDSDMLQYDMNGVLEDIERLGSGTPVMIDLKGGYGSFYYSSQLPDALESSSINVTSVENLIAKLQQKGFYTIARVSAFRDYYYGLNHVPTGLYMLSRAGLWADTGGCYWLDPTNSAALNWVSSIVLELRNKGFNEVLLTDFGFPDSEQYIFNGDKNEALLKAASSLMETCLNEKFVLSFSVDDPAFALPDGRCRIYLEGIDPKNVGATAAQVTIADPEVRLVFIAETNDTRFNEYSVFRSIRAAQELEEQKKD